MKHPNIRKIVLLYVFIAVIFNVYSQANSDSVQVINNVYKLGEIVITGQIDKQTLVSKDFQTFNTSDIGTALNALPSVAFTNIGGRNESSIYLRGFDIRSIPVFIDGIPVYVPYDGYVDLARFTTNGVSKIEVSTGFSSILYGANTIGGAINIVGIKPTKKLELNAKIGAMSGNGYEANLNLGSNFGKLYYQTNFSLYNRDYMQLSSDVEKSDFELDNKRDNSYRKDLKANVKLGYLVNKTDEYSINYSYAHGEKGNPVYLGTHETIKLHYWQWPYWDKESIYFASKTSIGKKSYLKGKLFYDRFKNELHSYDDNTFTTQEKGYAFVSFYNDKTFGGNMVFSSKINTKNLFKAAIHLKNDHHFEHNLDEPIREFADNTYSLGIEHIYNPVQKLTLIPGVSYNVKQSLKAEDYNSGSGDISELSKNRSEALNSQLGVYYNFNTKIQANFNGSYKSRFPTMKDRYSYRLGVAIPNPELKAEHAMNYEFGIKIAPNNKLSLHPEIYYSRLNSTIQMVSKVQDDLMQMQNTGQSEFYGGDVSLTYLPLKKIKLTGLYSYIKRNNISNPEILFIDVPDHKAIAAIEYSLSKSILLNLLGEYNSKRINESDGSRVSDGYYVMNFHSAYQFKKFVKLEFGVKNIFDKNYFIQEGYPEAGRNMYFALNFNL
ncbi:MAG: TonB-dependent receptor [Salinivirgaceae bacterium]|nr:TonB-dependent receptor [Salinivirgaceae bacterium]